MSCLDRFLGLDRDFSDFSDVSRQNRDFSISIEISRSSRLTFSNCRDFLDRRDWYFLGVEIEISIEITAIQIETPRLRKFWNKMFIKLIQTASPRPTWRRSATWRARTTAADSFRVPPEKTESKCRLSPAAIVTLPLPASPRRRPTSWNVNNKNFYFDLNN